MSTVAGSRWRAIAVGLMFLLIGLVAWDGADRRAVDATQPLPHGATETSLKSKPRTLKLASFNIHGGKGSDGVLDLRRISSVIENVDFAGLYEVRATSGGVPNQAASLATFIKGSWVYAPSERQWWTDHFGNALLHTIPLKNVVTIPLVNTRGKAFRNAVLSIVPLDQTDVRILSVHIDRGRDRMAQLKTIIDLFLSLEEPCVVMGDFNSTSAELQLDKLMHGTAIHSPLHEELGSRLPSQNIDWIFTRGLKTLSAELVENSASDHPAVRAELEPVE